MECGGLPGRSMSHPRVRTISAEEGADGLFENARRLIDGAHVAALQFHEHLCPPCGLMKAPAFADRNHLVISTVEEQDRRRDPADLPDRIEGAPHEQPQRK